MNKVRYSEKFYIPKNIADILDSLPLTKKHKDSACKFIKILITKSMRDSDLSMFEFTSMPYNYLSTIFSNNYKQNFLNLLIESEIIECNGYYSKTLKQPLKFRVSPKKWWESRFCKVVESWLEKEVVEVEEVSSCCNMSPFFSEAFESLGLQGYEVELKRGDKMFKKQDSIFEENAETLDFDKDKLFKTSLDNVRQVSKSSYKTDDEVTLKAIPIDTGSKVIHLKKEKAIEKASNEGKTLIQHKNKASIENLDEFIKKRKISKLYNDIILIQDLVDKKFRSSRNETNNRQDTNFTNMSGYLLDVVKDDNGLIEIDLCNSQIAISTLVMNLDTDDFRIYKELALNCQTYEYLQEKLNLSTRTEAKIVMFEVFFSSHKFKGESVTKMRKIFPTVMEWIDNYKKEKGDNQFAILLQKKESEIFIDNLYERLKNDYLIFSKHDSILCRKESEKEVREIIKTYFNEIGFNVMLR